MPDVTVAVLLTLDSKGAEGRYTCEALEKAGVKTWTLDMALRPHDNNWADVSNTAVAEASGVSLDELSKMGRNDAAETMIRGGIKVIQEKFKTGEISGAIGVGGANGSTMFCALMRSLPPLVPKVMVTPVAATAAVQWYVAESDIAMFPSIADISMNRIVTGAIDNAVSAIAAMSRDHGARSASGDDQPPLVGVTSFGNLQPIVNYLTEKLTARDYEVIHFHSSGPGGKALESLAGQGMLSGVLDICTSELCDLINGGVYAPGENRLTGAGKAGIPQVVAPGALDFTNWWVGEVPERFQDRDFFQYNVEILLMHSNEEEFETLGKMMAERLNAATGPVAVMIPLKGFSGISERDLHKLDGTVVGKWFRPEVDAVFTETLKANLKRGDIHELDLHVNDPAFGDACLETFFEMMGN